MEQLYGAAKRIDISTPLMEVNDSLCAKILLLKYKEKSYVLISIDSICLGGGIGDFSDKVYDKMKQRICECGVDSILCGTTHTHTEIPPMTQNEDEITDKICAAIKSMFNELTPIKTGSETGHNSTFHINRTLKLKDGSSWTIRQAHPCPPDEEIAEIPYADDSVGVIKFEKLDGSPLCVVFTFGCHPLLGYANKLPTANYPGIAEKLIEDNLGCVSMMFQSCAGDVTEVDYKNYDIPKCCYNLGISLGNTVLDTLKTIKTANSEITDSIKFISLPRRDDFDKVREQLISKLDEICKTLAYCPLNFKAFLPLYMKYLISPEYPLGYKYEYMREEMLGSEQLKNQDIINKNNIDKYLRNIQSMEKLSQISANLRTLEWHENYCKQHGGEDIKTEVVGIRLGDAVLISAPFEPLSETGRRIRLLSGKKNTYVIGYSNGYMHYGAVEEAYYTGGYETIECMLSKEWYGIYESAVKEIFDEIK